MRNNTPGGIPAVFFFALLLFPAGVRAQSRFLDKGAFGLQLSTGALTADPGSGFAGEVAVSISGHADVGFSFARYPYQHEEFRTVDSRDLTGFARIFFLRQDAESPVFLQATTALRRRAFEGDSLRTTDKGLSATDFILGVHLQGRFRLGPNWELQPSFGIDNQFIRERIAFSPTVYELWDFNRYLLAAELTLARHLHGNRVLHLTPGLQWNGRYMTTTLTLGWVLPFARPPDWRP